MRTSCPRAQSGLIGNGGGPLSGREIEAKNVKKIRHVENAIV